MDRIIILSEELKYFVLTGEKTKNRISKWKCNINECGKITEIWARMTHLRYNHINEFQEIDQKLPPKDITKNVYLELL